MKQWLQGAGSTQEVSRNKLLEPMEHHELPHRQQLKASAAEQCEQRDV